MFKPFQTRIALLAAILTLFLFSLAAALGFACRPGTPDGSRLDGGALDVDAGRTPRLNEAYTILPGPPGPAGPAGSAGDAGFSAFTTTTATFTQPAVLSNVTVSVVDTAAYAANEVLYVAGGGYYDVNAIGSGTLTLTNLGYPGNASPTSTVTSPALVTPGGLQGPQGATPDAGSATYLSPLATDGGVVYIAPPDAGGQVLQWNADAGAWQGATVSGSPLALLVPDANTVHAFSFADGDAGTPWQDTGSVGGWGPLFVKAGNPVVDGGVTLASGLYPGGTAADNGIFNTGWANTPMLYGAEGSGTELTPSFTISCWFLLRYNGGGNPQNIIGRSNQGSLASGTQFSIGLQMSSANFQAVMVIGGSPVSLSVNNLPFETNVWHHIGTTYDGANWNLYKDGNLVATKAQTGAITYTYANNGWGFLGAFGHGWSGTFEYCYGSIQNAWFDNVIRPASWFQTIWQQGSGQY